MKTLMMLLSAGFFLAANAQPGNSFAKNDIAYMGHDRHATKPGKREMKVKEVSYQAQQEFYSDFGNIPVSRWERSDYFNEATFTKDGKVFTAFYDYDAKLVGTTSFRTFADLPLKAQHFINQKYKGYSTGDVVFFDDNELNETDMTLYGLRFDDADNYFVELKKADKKIVVQVSMNGDVYYFSRIE